MAKAKIYCEVTCNNCGALACSSTYYKNASTITKIEKQTKDWIWDEEFGGNLCPDCQEELKRETEDAEETDVFDRWEITKVNP